MGGAEGDRAVDVAGRGRGESATVRYERSPRDLLRLLVLAAATVLVVGLTRWAEHGILGVEADLVELFTGLPTTAARIVGGAATLVAALAVLATVVAPLVARRYRLLGYVLLADALSAVLYLGMDRLVDHGTGSEVANQLGRRAALDPSSVLDTRVIVQLAAVVTVLAPFVGRRWQRAGAVLVAALLAVRIVVSVELPAQVFAGVLLGLTVGSAVLLALGRPSRRPTLAAIRAALADAGIPLADLRPAAVDARGSAPFFATAEDGTGLFVKVLGEDERAADLLFRAYRFLRLKNVGDERPFSNLRRTVEHEALVALAARDVGVRTPRLRGVVDVGQDSMLLAYEQLDGRSIEGLDDDAVTDEVMRATWEQVALLHRNRIAHRDLRRANVFVDAESRPWMIDFGFSELAASPDLLANDVAQLLASFAVVAGPARSVDAAIEVVGTDAVAAALPRLQLQALSGATQTALKAHKGLLAELQQTVEARCGVEEVKFEELSRITAKRLFTIAMIAAVTYFLLPQLADLPGMVDQIEEANWWWFAPLLVLSVLTYVGAAVAMIGAVPERLPPVPTFIAQLASSFASKLAPAGVGGMALNVRFLQKQGVPEPVAVSGVGLNTGAGFVGHASLMLVFLVWAGRKAFSSFRLPDPKLFVIVGAVLLVAGAVAMAVPYTRRLAVQRLAPVLRQGLTGVNQVAHRPSKVLALLGGSIFVTFCYLSGVYFAMRAFGGDLPYATVGACFLVGAAVATAAPTPGGLGAVEVALVAALTAAGLENTIAVPAVFLYRFATFWIPILPGWACFTYLRRTDYI